jgi:hypothetical protein
MNRGVLDFGRSEPVIQDVSDFGGLFDGLSASETKPHRSFMNNPG